MTDLDDQLISDHLWQASVRDRHRKCPKHRIRQRNLSTIFDAALKRRQGIRHRHTCHDTANECTNHQA